LLVIQYYLQFLNSFDIVFKNNYMHI